MKIYQNICEKSGLAVLLFAFAMVDAVRANAQAVVNKDFFTDGPIFTPIGVGTITNSNYVQTPSGQWQITVQGTLNNPDNIPNRAMRWDEDTIGTFCWVSGQEKIRLVVNPSGRINLSCKSDN